MHLAETKEGDENMRESRNGLRPVTVREGKTEFKGYLVGFNQEGNMQDGIHYYAAIEGMDGGISQYCAYDVQFDDVE